MKFFKKALVASAILAATGTVNAADITDATVKTSAQGIEVYTAVNTDTSTLRVIVREQLEAGDLITLKFGAGVDTTGITVDTLPAAGAAGTLDINYGSGT